MGDLMHDPCEPDDRLTKFVSDAYRGTPAAEQRAARERLDRALATARAPRVRRGAASWFAPRLWLVRPAFAAAAVVVAVALGFVLGRGFTPRAIDGRTPSTAAVLPTRPERTIEFVLVAPQASSVALVGDFNGWSTSATPLERQGDGAVWSVRVALPAGRHVYSFVMDGDRWVSDPQAPLEPANEFGVRNSVIVVDAVSPS